VTGSFASRYEHLMRAQEVEAILASLGATRHGVFSLAQVLARGVTKEEFRHQIDDGRVVRVGNGVFRLRDHPWTWHSKLHAALLLAGNDAVVSHGAAARLHECYRFRAYEGIDVLLPRGLDHRLPFGQPHETRVLPPDHVTTVDGFPATTVARTCFDLAGAIPPRLRARGAVGRKIHQDRIDDVLNDAFARRGLTFIAELAVFLALAKRGRAGTVLVRGFLRRYGPKYVPTYSDGESLLARMLDAWDVPSPKRQVPISDEQGWIGTVDFLWPDPKVIVEVTSRWHDGPLENEEDMERDRRLTAVGYDVLWIAAGTLIADPIKVRRTLVAALR
jgi:very-short-patch-repair endonuclease